MTLGIYVLVFLVVAVASTVQSSAGIGQGLIAAPLLRLIEPDLLPGPIVIAGFLTTVVVATRDGQPRDLRQVSPAIIGRFTGGLIAIGLLATLSERGLTIAIGIIVLVLVVLRLLGVRVAMTNRSLAGAGVASGIGGTIAALGGAPMGLLYEQHTKARDFRGPIAVFGVVGNGISLVLLALAGELGGQAWRYGLALLPPLAVGWVLARWVTPIIDRGFLSPIVLGVSSASAAALLITQLV